MQSTIKNKVTRNKLPSGESNKWVENSTYENEARLRLNAVLTYFLQLCFVSSNSLNEYGLLLFMLLAFSPSFCWLVSILWGQRRCVDFWTGGNCYNFYSSPPFLFPPARLLFPPVRQATNYIGGSTTVAQGKNTHSPNSQGCSPILIVIVLNCSFPVKNVRDLPFL